MVGASEQEQQSCHNASSNGWFRHGHTQSLVLERSNAHEDVEEDVGVAKGYASRSHCSLPRQLMGLPLDKDQARLRSNMSGVVTEKDALQKGKIEHPSQKKFS